ncbi:hypothetical protein [Reichenbachiella versicolor]|uniref:hypothetical protein n=1 Tax=Reichenbachiella versicolor TaxID=1821036 RepID=UPI0013A58513|nr:hypothetical protein [Reichenbachiella versicolor]
MIKTNIWRVTRPVQLFYFGLVLIFYVGSAPAVIAQDQAEVDKIKTDIEKRLPSFEMSKIDYKPWNFYWAYGKGELIPGIRSKVRIDYDSTGSWVDMRQQVRGSSSLTDELRSSLLGIDFEKNFRNLEYMVTSYSDPYYKVTLKSGELFCLTQDFKRMDYGAMHIEGIMTDKIMKDIDSRLENWYVYEGKAADEPGHYQFQVVFKTDYVDYQKGKVVYSKDGDWSYTRYYMNSYDYLPMDLMMYVADNGGLENFGRVSYDKSAEEEYYSIEFKDGKRIKLDMGFNVMGLANE